MWRVLDFAGALVVNDDSGDVRLSVHEIHRAQIWRGRAHNELGEIFRAHADYFKAIEHYKCAAHLFQAAKDQTRESAVHSTLLRLYAGAGGVTPPLFRDRDLAIEEATKRAKLPKGRDEIGWNEARNFLNKAGVRV